MRAGQRARAVAAVLCCALALFPAAAALHADDITTAQQQLQQVSARRAAAEQRLADAKREVSALNLQTQTNAQQLRALEQQTAALRAQANAREATLNGDLSTLETRLEAARSQLATKQQEFAAQSAAAQSQLTMDQQELRGAQEELRQADTQRSQLERDAQALSGQLTAMDADVASRSQQIQDVLVQMYKLSQTSALSLILSASSVSDGLNRLTLLGMVSQHDQDLMVKLANERDLASHHHQVLTDELASTQQLEAELQADREEISVRAGGEAQAIQQLQDQIAQSQASFQQQASVLDSAMQSTRAAIATNRQQFAANRAPLDAQHAKVAAAQHTAVGLLGNAKQQQASAESQIASAERDQAAATQLIQQLQAAAAARAAAERAAEQARQAAEQARQAAARRAAAPAASAVAASSGNTRFAWPLQGPITQGYGPTNWTMEPPGHGYAHWHTGIDIAAGYGSAIHAAAGGVVIHTGWLGGGNWGYGNCIIIVHDGTFSTLYGHLSGVAVRPDQVVQQGQVIGYEGSTGNSTGPHLHFEIRVNGNPVNPYAYL